MRLRPSLHSLGTALLALGLAATAAWAQPYAFTTVDPSQPFSTIVPGGINDSGTISGLWVDTAQVSHGFIVQGGIFTSFDAPLADTTKVGAVRGTAAGGIDSAGNTVGVYTAGGTQHGFIRSAAGSFTTLDIAGHADTQLIALNDGGQIIGSFADSAALLTGTSFLRSAGGVLTTVSMPASTFSQPQGLNNAGTIVGAYFDAANAQHGFVRAANGVYTTLDVPGADATLPSGINNAGWIVGEYDVAGVGHGFVRDPLGAITTVDVAGAVFTSGTAIDNLGDLVGQFCDTASVCHGFFATPVPEPAAPLLLLAGLGLVGLRARRRPGEIKSLAEAPGPG